jgi:hypothetical protein
MEKIHSLQKELTHHPIYSTFTDLEALRHFMETHIFAVWDFMSLLKSLQRSVTCVEVPWAPSTYPTEIVRFVNQIVVGEESDLDQNGVPVSHFELYLKGMEEVGASTALIRDFLATRNISHLPPHVQIFVSHNLNVALNGHPVEVAASFFFGREKLIPTMFQTIVDTLKINGVKAPTMLYYLERHIEVDGEEHGPLALRCLDALTQGNPDLQMKAQQAGVEALEKRKELWNGVLATSPSASSPFMQTVSLSL